MLTKRLNLLSKAPSIFGLTLCFVYSIVCGDERTLAQPISPHRQAHAHNDYRHDRPLLDALDHGFCSVEADIFLEKGALLVGHTKLELSPERTLQSLYLNPLRDRIAENNGTVFPELESFTLLIDIKSSGEETYQELHRVLEQYSSLFTRVEDGTLHKGPITAIVSGNRPIQSIENARVRYVGIDGNLADLESQRALHLMPLISDNWPLHFRWRGTGDILPEERNKLKEIVRRAHEKQRRVRFWGTPDNEAIWRLLHDEQVDLINTDDLAGLSRFLTSTQK